MTVLVVLPNTSGHSSMLIRLIDFLKKKYYFLDFEEYIIDYIQRKSTNPKIFCFENLKVNTEKLLEKYYNSSIELIITDYFSVEGFVLSKILNIPLITSCSATVDVNRFPIDEKYFLLAL